MHDDAVFIPGRGIIATVDVSALKQHGDALKFEYTDRFGMVSEGFVLRYRSHVVAFENRCPHWSIPLDAEENQFLDASQSFIFCPMHGASFDAESGQCFQGPCLGEGLERFEVAMDGEHAVIKAARPKLKF